MTAPTRMFGGPFDGWVFEHGLWSDPEGVASVFELGEDDVTVIAHRYLAVGNIALYIETEQWKYDDESVAIGVSESICQQCHGPNPVWSAPNEVWNSVVGTPDNPRGEGVILCFWCFISRMESANAPPDA